MWRYRILKINQNNVKCFQNLNESYFLWCGKELWHKVFISKRENIRRGLSVGRIRVTLFHINNFIQFIQWNFYNSNCFMIWHKWTVFTRLKAGHYVPLCNVSNYKMVFPAKSSCCKFQTLRSWRNYSFGADNFVAMNTKALAPVICQCHRVKYTASDTWLLPFIDR